MEERDQFYLNLGNALYAIASFRKGLLEPDEDVDFYDGSFTTLNVLKALSGYSEEHRSNVWDAAEWLTECVETEQLMHSSLAGL